MNMNTDNRVSPQAPEIEEAILGACLIEQEAMPLVARSEEHTSELQSHSDISYAVFCLKKIFF